MKLMENFIDRRSDEELARLLWDYHHLDQDLIVADLILVLGSHDLRVAERAVELYRERWAPRILFSGRRGVLTQDWQETEAERFASWARAHGVPEEAILVEQEATNTGENIRYAWRMLRERDIIPASILLVQKPYMERRTLATFLRQWPGPPVKVAVTSPRIPFERYPTDEIPLQQVIHILVGDLFRLRDYPALGYQVPVEIPDEVMAAAEELVGRGYSNHLPRGAG